LAMENSMLLAVVESRARRVDLSAENYYDLLYAFHVSRCDYRKAATYSYELAMRYRREGTGLEALRRQLNALSACLHTLEFETTEPWIQAPGSDQEMDGDFESAGSSPKRDSDGEEKESVPSAHSRRIEKKEIESEYILAKGNLAVAERGAAFTAFLSPTELVKSLMRYNFFDLAVNVSVIFDLPLTEVIDALAFRCVQSDKPRLATGLENEFWTWLKENKSICTVISDQRSQSFAWAMLQAYLQHLSKITPPSPLYAAATRRFLSLSQTLPPWFIDQFKKIDFPELLRLLIEFNQLSDAQKILCDYIDAALGIGSEDFDLQETLTVGKPAPVWLPFSLIDFLLMLFAQKRDDIKFTKLRAELEDKLNRYFNQLDNQMTLARKK